MKPGKFWVCIDPNKVIKWPKYQVPTLEEILHTLAKVKIFKLLDAKDNWTKLSYIHVD